MITSLFEYEGGILVSRLGSGTGGQSILRIQTAGQVKVPISTGLIDLSIEEKYRVLCSTCHGSEGIPFSAGLVSESSQPETSQIKVGKRRFQTIKLWLQYVTGKNLLLVEP